MRNVKYHLEPRRVFPVNGFAPGDRAGPSTGGHGRLSVASGLYNVHKTLPLRPARLGELQPGSRAHTNVVKVREFPQPYRHKNSFIVAKLSEPIRFSCNPGALLLLPPSLVRAGALRSIFITPVPA